MTRETTELAAHRQKDQLSARAISAGRLVFFVLAIAMAMGMPQTSRAQSQGLLSSSYITPFPQTDRYQVRFIGDWFGPGVTEALKDAFKQDNSLEIVDMSRGGYGLVRAEQSDLYGEIGRMIAGPPVHVAIIMLGLNDRASIKSGAGFAKPGTSDWKEAYAKEAEKLIKRLKAANIAVYWVGLPVMGDPQRSEGIAQMNDAVRQAAYVNGVKFIETWAGFTDQMGAYSAYGPDLSGQTKRLRDGDGIGFTAAGYRKLANYIETVLRRDLAHAKAQRNIPLAGDEEEQARVVPNVSRPAAASSATAAPPSESPQKETSASKPSSVTANSQEDTAKFKTETTTAPSQTRQEAQTRAQTATGEGGYQASEFVLNDLGDGLTAIAIISTAGDFSMREIQRQTPLVDRLYFKVLSRGEMAPPKEGRADDFRWRGDAASNSQ